MIIKYEDHEDYELWQEGSIYSDFDDDDDEDEDAEGDGFYDT